MVGKNKLRQFNTVIVVIALLVAITIGSIYVLDKWEDITGKVITITKTIEVDIAEVKPSYDYLKSITVFLTGEEVVVGRIRRWTGTGTVVKVDNNYTYILTNKHVVGEGKEGVTVYVDNGLRKIETEIIEVHATLDLAVVKVKEKLLNKKAVKGFSTASPQTPLYLVGHHLGRKYVYGEGVFAGYDGIFDIIQVPVLFGNSGTGVCNKDGELIGVVFAINKVGFGVDSSHGLVIDGTNVKLFLQKLNLL